MASDADNPENESEFLEENEENENEENENEENEDEDDEDELPLFEHESDFLEYKNDKLSEDVAYFNKEGKKENHPSRTKISFEGKEEDGLARIKNDAYFGALKLPSGKQINFKTKTPTIPVKLLDYATGVRCNDNKMMFYSDVEYEPTINQGVVFLTFLAEVYLQEMDKILTRGLVKEYVRKEENQDYLKGKLKFQEHIRNNYVNPKFYCSYHDLTYDNFCNQMVIYAGYVLTNMLEAENLRYRIFNIVEDLKDIITLKYTISPTEANNVTITKKNEHYETILDVCKIIINEAFYQQRGPEAPLGFNYLIDMNVVFERAVFKLFSNVLKEPSGYINLRDQESFSNVDLIKIPRKKQLTLKPDIVVYDQNDPKAVIETKYKVKIHTANFYQILIYSLFFKANYETFKAGILVHYEEDLDDDIKLYEGRINLNEYAREMEIKDIEDVKLYRIGLNIKETEDQDFRMEDIEERLKDKLREDEEWAELAEILKFTKKP